MSYERPDGRGLKQLRPVVITRSYLDTTPGSALIKMGSTKVICTLSIEEKVPPFLIGKGRGWLTAEYGMLPGSSRQRIARESTTGKPNGRTREIQRLIGRSLRSIIDLEQVGERTFYLDCDVIQADGGTRTASITGAYVALVEGINWMCRQGVLKVNPLREAVAAVSVGIVEDQVLLDLCYVEDSQAETDMNVVMTGAGGIVEIQGTAEGKTFTREEMNRLLDAAESGIQTLLSLQAEVLQGLD